MLGSNPNAVIESLKRARRLHGSSMALIGFVLLIAILGISKPIKFLNTNLEINPNRFGLLAMPMAVGLLTLAASFMSDALKGARYLHDRYSAMMVGNFPWVLTKYAGSRWAGKVQSLITRFVMAFHPFAYFFYLGKFDFFRNPLFNTFTFQILFLLLIALSAWIFIISWRFQKPILFDTRTEDKEKNQKDNFTKLTEAVEKQTAVVSEQVSLLKKTDGSLQKRAATRKQKVVKDNKKEGDA